MRQAIRNIRSEKRIPPKFCEVVIEGDNINLEVKNSNKEIVTIPWGDMKYQVEVAKKRASRM